MQRLIRKVILMKNKAIIMIVCILILSGCAKTNNSHSEKDADTKPETVDQASTTEISQTEAENYEGYSGNKETTASQTTEPDIFDIVYKKYYASWTEREMQNEIAERKQYRDQCSFYPEVSNYLENVREVRDISSVVEPLYFTDLKIYQKQDFQNQLIRMW